MDSKIPPDPAAAGGFPNSSDTNEDDEDEPVAAVVDEEKEEEEDEDDDAGMEDPSIASNNRTKTLTEKRDLERRGRRSRKEKGALNKDLKCPRGHAPPSISSRISDIRRRLRLAPARAVYEPGLLALRMGRSGPFVLRTAAKGCPPRGTERRRKGRDVGPVGDKVAYLKLVAMGPHACCSVEWWGPLAVGIWSPRETLSRSADL